jgi:hypothetical protein
MASYLSVLVVTAGYLLLAALLSDGGELAPLPEGDAGLAARSPGDAGIGKDPAVVFHADFEDCRSGADVSRQWGVVDHGAHLSIAEGPAHVNGGRKALEWTMPQQGVPLSVEVAHYLPEPCDVLFFRFYTRYQEGFAVPRTSVHNGAAISARYYPGGRATPGQRADGRNKFLANLETETTRRDVPSPGPLNVYLYHPEQRGNYGDHIYPTGVVKADIDAPHNFGPHFVPRPDFVPELGRWYCFEYMLRTNTPGARDGRIACWVDGTLIADFANLRLRDTEELKIDRIGLCMYIADNHLRENRKWHDDVVAATSYIGPRMSGEAK